MFPTSLQTNIYLALRLLDARVGAKCNRNCRLFWWLRHISAWVRIVNKYFEIYLVVCVFLVCVFFFGFVFNVLAYISERNETNKTKPIRSYEIPYHVVPTEYLQQFSYTRPPHIITQRPFHTHTHTHTHTPFSLTLRKLRTYPKEKHVYLTIRDDTCVVVSCCCPVGLLFFVPGDYHISSNPIKNFCFQSVSSCHHDVVLRVVQYSTPQLRNLYFKCILNYVVFVLPLLLRF